MNQEYHLAANKRKKRIKFFCFFIIQLIVIAFIGGIIVGINLNRRRNVVKDSKLENVTRNQEQGKQDDQIETFISSIQSQANITDTSNWKLLLVNPWNKLPDDFTVELANLINGQAIDERAYPDLQEMMDDARAEGLEPMICSSFRSQEKQQRLFQKQANKYISDGYSEENAAVEAAKWIAIPGTSEHQTGLALDIVSANYQTLDEGQENTPEQQWLMKNSYKYGFILRYPTDKSEITGIEYEPWHYRYVGKEVAKEMYMQGICLEE